MLRQLPNALTLFRLLAAPVVGLVLIALSVKAVPVLPTLPLITVLFVLACLSDFLDGFLARRLKLESTFGAILDPIGDKVLVLATCIGILALLPKPMLAIPILALLSRDLVVGGLREAALARGWRLAVGWGGKLKTVLVCAALGLVLMELSAVSLGMWTAQLVLPSTWIALTVWAAAIVSWGSGLAYLMEFIKKGA